MKKKILIINGSPRKSGNTELLVDSFIKGANESGNIAQKINLRELNINNCIGCLQCQEKKGNPCIQKDDMDKLYSAFNEADMVVFASPLYWMHFTALLKNAMERLFALAPYGIPQKETALIMAATTQDDFIYSMIVPYFETCIVNNLNWINRGMVLAGGVNDKGDVEKTNYLQEAYELGKQI